MAHYKFTPVANKHIDVVLEMYRKNKNGTISNVDVREVWSAGVGFLECEDEAIKTWEEERVYTVDNYSGENEGCEFEGLVDVEFDFSDDVSQKERDKFIKAYYDGDKQGRSGASFLYEGQHEWSIEVDYVEVFSPARIELCDENGEVIRQLKIKKSK